MKLGVLAGIHEDVVRLQQAFDVLDGTGCEAIPLHNPPHSVPSWAER